MGRSTRRRQRQAEDEGSAPADETHGKVAASEDAVQDVGAEGACQQEGLSKPSAAKPSESLVLRALETLYEDELRPFGRILRKRVAELAARAPAGEDTAPRTVSTACTFESAAAEASVVPAARASEELPDVDARHLREVCEGSGAVVVEAEDGGDWVALLIGRECNFVDIYSREDKYPEGFWDEATAYLDSLSGEEAELPGGRYSCARALVARGLPFLRGYSLGQVCHIVQIAISQRKVLGYFNGAVVPYSLSLSMLKERCAKGQTQCANAAGGPSGSAPTGPLQPASWEVALRFTKEIVDSAPSPPEGGPPQVPLSNVKRLFRSRYCLDLSETALGYSKLSELLHDPRFESVCRVQLQGQGYVVVPVSPPSGGAPPEGARGRGPTPSRASGSCHPSPAPSRGSTAGDLEASPPRRSPGSSACRGSPTLLLSDSLPVSGSESAFRRPSGVKISLAQSIRVDDDTCREETGGGTTISLANSLMSTPPGLSAAGGSGTAISLADFLPAPSDDDFGFGQPRRLFFPCADGEALDLDDSSPRSLAGSWLPDMTPMRSPGVPGDATVRRWAGEPCSLQFFPDGMPLELPLEAGSPLAAHTPLASPGVAGDVTRRRWASGTYGPDPLLFPEFLEPAVVHSPLASPRASPGVAGSTSLRGSPDLPCHIEFFPGGAPPSPHGSPERDEAAASRVWEPALSPSGLVCGGRLTKNTFIDELSPAASPLGAAAARRARSLPRSMGLAVSLDMSVAAEFPGCVSEPPSGALSSQVASGGPSARDPSPAAPPAAFPGGSPRCRPGPDAVPLKVTLPLGACGGHLDLDEATGGGTRPSTRRAAAGA